MIPGEQWEPTALAYPLLRLPYPMPAPGAIINVANMDKQMTGRQ